jgi:NADH-quinone oxidoreductase subunit I
MPTTSTSLVRNYFSNIYKAVSTTASAFTTASRHLFTHSYTLQYPRHKAELPDLTRHRLHVVIEDCIGCLQCERACPVECIKIDAVKAPKEVDLGQASAGNPINFYLPSFTIDMAQCCYCGLCTEPCPTKCIVMTPNYEYSTYELTDLVYQFAQMTDEEKVEMERLVADDQKKKAEEKAKKAREAAEKAAEEKAAVPEEETAAAPAETASDALAKETSDAPAKETSDAPAKEASDAPAEEVSDAPAEEVSDAPAEEVSDTPAEEASDAPAGAPAEGADKPDTPEQTGGEG